MLQCNSTLFSILSNFFCDIDVSWYLNRKKQNREKKITIILGLHFFNLWGHFSWSSFWLAAGDFFKIIFSLVCVQASLFLKVFLKT